MSEIDGKIDAGGFTGGPWGTVGKAADLVSGLLPQPSEYSGDKGGITQGLDGAYDKISDVAMKLGPYGLIVGGAMKLGGLANKGMKKLGAGTDGMTTTDAILGSNFLGPAGWINGWAGSKADTINKDMDTFGLMGSSYGGTEYSVNSAVHRSGKKYGLLSSGARNKANSFIHQMGLLLATLRDLATETNLNNETLANLSGLAGFSAGFEQSGGYDMAGTRAAKYGAKLTLSNLNKARNIINKPKLNIVEFKEGGKTETLKPTKLPKNVSRAVRVAKKGNKLKKTKTSFEASFDFLNDLDPILVGHENDNPNYSPLKSEKKEVTHSGGNVFEDKESKEFTSRLKFNRITEEGLYEYSDPVTGLNELYDMLIFKEGGLMNVIPEGALHAHKHHMENDEHITKKGIPVVSEEDGGNIKLLAEIERNEIIFNLEVTKKLEELNKTYNSEESSLKEKDEAAIEAGKLLTEEILNNTDDRTGLIDTIE